jgi:hypothetical protein
MPPIREPHEAQLEQTLLLSPARIQGMHHAAPGSHWEKSTHRSLHTRAAIPHREASQCASPIQKVLGAAATMRVRYTSQRIGGPSILLEAQPRQALWTLAPPLEASCAHLTSWRHHSEVLIRLINGALGDLFRDMRRKGRSVLGDPISVSWIKIVLARVGATPHELKMYSSSRLPWVLIFDIDSKRTVPRGEYSLAINGRSISRSSNRARTGRRVMHEDRRRTGEY